jgi:hypothetical protein
MRYSLLIDNITVNMITVEINLTGTNPATATIVLAIIVATATTATTARIPEIHALFTRNHTTIHRSIPKRNKTLKRPDSSQGTLADSILNYLPLASVLIRVISNMLLVLRVISMTITT